ncbi:hypothetical protein [Furfurilactobacillus curtus]|uniref:Uncharacterized protein n=1 Tax=Furfurilactobacillus curtus TaxID=1746200 RepID=A0ABQ5JLR6_9LACO
MQEKPIRTRMIDSLIGTKMIDILKLVPYPLKVPKHDEKFDEAGFELISLAEADHRVRQRAVRDSLLLLNKTCSKRNGYDVYRQMFSDEKLKKFTENIMIDGDTLAAFMIILTTYTFWSRESSMQVLAARKGLTLQQKRTIYNKQAKAYYNPKLTPEQYEQVMNGEVDVKTLYTDPVYQRFLSVYDYVKSEVESNENVDKSITNPFFEYFRSADNFKLLTGYEATDNLLAEVLPRAETISRSENSILDAIFQAVTRPGYAIHSSVADNITVIQMFLSQASRPQLFRSMTQSLIQENDKLFKELLTQSEAVGKRLGQDQIEVTDNPWLRVYEIDLHEKLVNLKKFIENK